MGIIRIPFIYTRNDGDTRWKFSKWSFATIFASMLGKQLYSRNPPSVVIVASPFFEKLIQSPPLPGLQNFQSMSMGKRNRSLDEGGGAGWLLVFRNHSISRFVSRKFFCILLPGGLRIFSRIIGTNAIIYIL